MTPLTSLVREDGSLDLTSLCLSVFLSIFLSGEVKKRAAGETEGCAVIRFGDLFFARRAIFVDISEGI